MYSERAKGVPYLLGTSMSDQETIRDQAMDLYL